jgi:hypothetical protein
MQLVPWAGFFVIHSSSCTTLEMKLEKFDHCHTQQVMVMLHQIEMLKTVEEAESNREVEDSSERWW